MTPRQNRNWKRNRNQNWNRSRKSAGRFIGLLVGISEYEYATNT